MIIDHSMSFSYAELEATIRLHRTLGHIENKICYWAQASANTSHQDDILVEKHELYTYRPVGRYVYYSDYNLFATNILCLPDGVDIIIAGKTLNQRRSQFSCN